MSTVVKKAVSWTVIAAGVLFGVLALAILELRGIGGIPLYAVVICAVIPTWASLTAGQDPRRAGFLYLYSAPVAAVSFFLADIDRLRLGMSLWYVQLGYALFAALLIFGLPALFWIVTHHYGWPTVLTSPTRPSRKLRLRGAAIACCWVCALFLCAVITLAAFIPPEPSECEGIFTIAAKPMFRGHSVFRAHVIHTLGSCQTLGGKRVCTGAVATVQKEFFGIHSRVVLLNRGIFESGQDYLIDGERDNGLVTQFLPIVGLRPCGRSKAVRDAALDLRVLQDGLQDGARIIGKVRGRNRVSGLPGKAVIITGPTGEITATTDKDGSYDVSGLSPGNYTVRIDEPAMTVGRGICERMAAIPLKNGDVVDCSF
jgi:hypothetical protein